MPAAETQATACGYAKINLFLHLTGRRADGYHLLDSLFAFVGIGDDIRVFPSGADRLQVSGPYADQIDGPSDDNLMLKALRAAREALGARGVDLPPCEISLDKQLPVAAGIGGGSADAAALLRTVQDFSPDLARCDLPGLALSLGADVPAALESLPVRVGGIGEQLDPVMGLPAWHCVLVNPNIPLSTPAVFKAFRESGTAFSAPAGPVPSERWQDWLASLHNDLQGPAIALVPEIEAVLRTLADQPGSFLTRMSGSGATCFALFDGADEACAAAQNLQQEWPSYWVRAGALRR